MKILAAIGTFTLSLACIAATGPPAGSVSTADASLGQLWFDGSADLFEVRNQYYLVALDARTQFTTDYAAGQPPTGYSWALADFNADNIPDLYGAGGQDSRVAVLDGATGYRQTLLSTSWYPGSPMGYGNQNLAADYDHDGRGDWYSFYTQGSSVSMQVSTASSNFQSGLPRTALASIPTGPQVTYTLGDYNGDGRFDVYALTPLSAGTTRVSVFDAASNFSNLLTEVTLAVNLTTDKVIAGDYDQDGRSDLYVTQASGSTSSTLSVLGASSSFANVLLSSTISGSRFMAAAMTFPDNSDGREEDPNDSVIIDLPPGADPARVSFTTDDGASSAIQARANAATWGACTRFPPHMDDEENDLVAQWTRKRIRSDFVGSKAYLNCGREDVNGRGGYGFYHLFDPNVDRNGNEYESHQEEFERIADQANLGWIDVADTAIEGAVGKPTHAYVDISNGRDYRYCTSKKILVGYDDEIIDTFYGIVILGATGRKIITAYASERSCVPDATRDRYSIAVNHEW